MQSSLNCHPMPVTELGCVLTAIAKVNLSIDNETLKRPFDFSNLNVMAFPDAGSDNKEERTPGALEEGVGKIRKMLRSLSRE